MVEEGYYDDALKANNLCHMEASWRLYQAKKDANAQDPKSSPVHQE